MSILGYPVPGLFGPHGYTMWVTVPDDFPLPEGIQEEHFPGGLYAAHTIRMGDFHEWEWLIDWARNSEDYEIVWGDPQRMHGLLEEQRNYVGNLNNANLNDADVQLDLLLPVRRKA